MTLDRILCPVDFSEASLHALEHAAALARQYRSHLTVQHVYVPAFVPVPMLPPPHERVSEQALARAHDDVAGFVNGAGISVDTKIDIVVDVGHAPVTILDRAARLPADLVIMGTHGTSGFERFILGSTTEKVLRKAAAPVLTVPPRVHSTSQLPFRRILCAVDFSSWSDAAVSYAASLGIESDAAVTLVHVVEWPWRESHDPSFTELSADQAAALNEYRRYVECAARDRLQAIVPAALASRGRVDCTVTHGKGYAEILRLAAETASDLIVMGVHGRNPIDLALFGSTTNHVVRAATCPVLTLRR